MLVPHSQKVQSSRAVLGCMLMRRSIESQIDAFRELETILGGFGCCLHRNITVSAMVLVQSEILRHGSKDRSVKVDVAAKDDVIAR